MLELAYQTLRDFDCALEMLESVEDDRQFRVLCVAAASLNRSVGYAIKHDPDSQIRQIGNLLFDEWKADDNCIFNTFILPYRNHVLHDTELDIETDVQLVVFDPHHSKAELFDTGLLYVPVKLNDNDFDGLDIRDLFQESKKWWSAQLQRIETELKKNNAGGKLCIK